MKHPCHPECNKSTRSSCYLMSVLLRGSVSQAFTKGTCFCSLFFQTRTRGHLITQCNSIPMRLIYQGQVTCNHTFTPLHRPQHKKKKKSPPPSHRQHHSSTHCSTSHSCCHGEGPSTAKTRRSPGPRWSGVSPRWHGRRAAE